MSAEFQQIHPIVNITSKSLWLHLLFPSSNCHWHRFLLRTVTIHEASSLNASSIKFHLERMEIAEPELPGVNGNISQQLAIPINPEVVVEHLTSLLEITLDATLRDLQGPGSLLSEKKRPETIQRCQHFAAESQTVLYVQKDLVASEKTNGTNGHTSE